MLIFGQPWHLPPNYGDVPTWLAAGFAAVAAWVSLDQLRTLRTQVDREASDRQRAQASRVFVWTDQTASTVLSQAQRAAAGQQQPLATVVTHIRNSSEQPIYDLMVTWHQGAALRGSIDSYGVVLPGTPIDVSRELAPNFNPASRGPFKVTLSFRDAAGVRWTVDQDGHLAESDG